MQITGCFNSIWTYFYSEKSTDLKDLLKNYRPSYFSFCETSLNLKLRSIQRIQLKATLEEVLTDLIHEDNLQDIFSTIENLAPALPLEKLSNEKDVLTEAHNMVREAKLYLSYHQSSYLPGLYDLYVQIVDALALGLDTLFSIFGIRELFTPVENESEGFSRHQKMILLFNLSTVLTSLIISLQLSTSFGVLAIAGTFLFIGLLNLIWPHIKPMPSQLPGNIRNLTQELRNQDPYVVVRKSTLDKIVNLIQRNIHPILVGPSQIGKTRTAEALAYSFCHEEYPAFNHHRVFYANATELTGQTSLAQGQNTIFKRIKDVSGRHFRSLFLILDECHMLYKNKERTGELIKTLLDENAPFPFIIGITTLEEYEAHIKPNKAFKKRFKRVYIK
ncbi:MAG: AAA family ATPase, partial [Parachlamydiaceae bacterium]